jgi:hypothetical protein
MIRAAALIALTFSAWPATADTSCGMEFGRWVCRETGINWQTQKPFDATSAIGAFEAGRRARVERELDVAERQAMQEDALRASARKKAGSMLAGGDCAGALSTALSAGDIQLASEVRTFCQAEKPPVAK